jgi:hypothetical protein
MQLPLLPTFSTTPAQMPRAPASGCGWSRLKNPTCTVAWNETVAAPLAPDSMRFVAERVIDPP